MGDQVPLLSISVAIAGTTVLATLVARNAERARRHALVGLSSLLVATTGSALRLLLGSAPVARDSALPWLAIDAASAPLPVLATVVALATFWLAPRSQLGRRGSLDAVWVCTTTVIAFSTDVLPVFAVAFVCGAFSIARWSISSSESAAPSAALRTPWIGSVTLLAAIAWLGLELGSVPRLFGGAVPSLDPTTKAIVIALVALASMSRMGIFPLHGWVPATIRRGEAPRAIGLISPLLGAYLLLRFAVLFPGAFAIDLWWLAPIGLVSAAYFAIVALGQRSQLGAALYLVMSQIGLVFLGLADADPLSVSGALVLWLAQGVAGAGLLLSALAVRARRGEVTLSRFHGLGHPAPHLALAYFLFGIAVVGLPGTLTFVAEDLIAQGMLTHHPWLAAGYVLVTALDAIVFLRLFGRVFLGNGARAERHTPDLGSRERWAAMALAAILFVSGILPYSLVATRGDVAVDLVERELGAEPAGTR